MKKFNRTTLIIVIVALVGLIAVVLILSNGNNGSLFGTAMQLPVVDVAYSDLSNRLGKPVSADNSVFQWQAVTFPDSSLGCPQPGVNYTKGQIQGYRITISFAGKTYDYRTTASNGTYVVFCPAGNGTTDLAYVPPTSSGSVTEPKALIDAVLADLSKRQGKTFSRSNSHYDFNYSTAYASTDLGCPQAGKTYDKKQTTGWQIVITPDAGGKYDYRALDEKNFWFCAG